MAEHEYGGGSPSSREAIFTPIGSDDDIVPAISSLSLGDKTQKLYRMFKFVKQGKLWKDGSKCSEVHLSLAEIKAEMKKQSKAKSSIPNQLQKMSEVRRAAIDELMVRLDRAAPRGSKWAIVAIDDETVMMSNRKAEVQAFTVTLELLRVQQDRSRSYVRDRYKRRSSTSPDTRQPGFHTEYASASARRRSYAPSDHSSGNRRSRTYSQSPSSSWSGRPSFRQSQALIDDDPFAVIPVISQQGKPLDLHGNAPYDKHGLPPTIPREAPIGGVAVASANNKPKKGGMKTKKQAGTGAFTDANGDLDIETLLASKDYGSGTKPHFGGVHHSGALVEDYHLFPEPEMSDESSDEADVIAVGGDHLEIGRGRGMKSGSRYGSKIPEAHHYHSKSKSRSRKPSLAIPSYSDKQRSHVKQMATSEDELEDYTSSSSHNDLNPASHGDYQGTYRQADGRYYRDRNTHRASSFSHGTYGDYSLKPADGYGLRSRFARPENRPRMERFASGSPMPPHRHLPSSPRRIRPAVINHGLTPRYEPSYSPYPRGSFDDDRGLLIYPDEIPSRARQDRLLEDEIRGPPTSALDRDGYGRERLRRDHDFDREYELRQREKDVAKREADVNRAYVETLIGTGRRQSMVERGDARERPGKKYDYEPRATRRYLEAYHT